MRKQGDVEEKEDKDWFAFGSWLVLTDDAAIPLTARSVDVVPHFVW